MHNTQPFPSRAAFIVGAPRTGTTAISRMLRAHFDVYFSNVKEPHFFAQHDLAGESVDQLRSTVEREYLERYFPDWRNRTSALLMEGSVKYLYVAKNMAAILRLWPNAKFIIGLRNPTELLTSLHQRLFYLGDESERDFERAWALLAERKAGRKVPRSCIDPRWLHYDESGRLGRYVQQFIEVVGRKRCMFVLHEDLRSDTANLYRQVQDFLEVPRFDYQDLAPKRASRGVRSGHLQRLLMRPPFARQLLAGKHYRQRVEKLQDLRRQDGSLRRLLEDGRSRLLRWNRTTAPPVQLSPELRSSMRDLFKDDVRLLESIIERDLGHWLSDIPPATHSD